MQRMKIWKKQKRFVSVGLELDIPAWDAMRIPHRNGQPGIVSCSEKLSHRERVKDLQNEAELPMEKADPRDVVSDALR